jgi:hypothetical protein
LSFVHAALEVLGIVLIVYGLVMLNVARSGR